MRFRSVLISIFLAILSSVSLATTTFAHTDVVSTSPEDGAVIDVTPAEVSITFSEPPISQGAAIVLADISGNELPLGDVEIDGTTIKAASPSDLIAGDYVVNWRVSAQDGHVITGKFTFTFTGKVSVTNPTNTVTAGTTESPIVMPIMDEAETGESGRNLLVSLVATFIAGLLIASIIATRRRK